MRFMRIAWVPMLAAGLVVGGCTADVEQEGELPEVNVEGGQMPEVDVDPADVDITTDTQTIVTPDIDVNEAPQN